VTALVFKFLANCEAQLFYQILAEVYTGYLFIVEDHQDFFIVLICDTVVA